MKFLQYPPDAEIAVETSGTLRPYDADFEEDTILENYGTVVPLPESAPIPHIPVEVEQISISRLKSAPASLAASAEQMALPDSEPATPSTSSQPQQFHFPPVVALKDVKGPSSLNDAPGAGTSGPAAKGEESTTTKKKGHRRISSFDPALLHTVKEEKPKFERTLSPPPAESQSQSQTEFDRMKLKPLKLQEVYGTAAAAGKDGMPSSSEESPNVSMAYLLLEQRLPISLQPLPPCLSSAESMAIFKEHCQVIFILFSSFFCIIPWRLL